MAVLAVLSELLPVVFGTGADASVDWSFIYVTLRFVLLPAASVVLILYAAVRVLRPAGTRERLLWASATLVPAGYLALLWFHPLFFFA